MKQYLDQLEQIVNRGAVKDQRAVLKDGTKPKIFHLFGLQARYDLEEGFPLLTSKFVPFRIVAEELFWFLRGSTDNRELTARNVHIWDDWADPETGDLGPIYGKQWRSWDVPGGGTVDQIKNLIRDIRAVRADPHHSCGRRMILTAWNPADIPKMKGPFACHTLSHFVVTGDKLSCHMFQRSADMFLGVPFNIASYALLTYILAHLTGLRVGTFVHSISDAHVYENHLDVVRAQLRREPRPLPRLDVAIPFTDPYALTPEHFTLTGYNPHGKIPAEVAV